MTGMDDDRELDDFLARRSTLHRRLADRDRADPSPELDRLVLGKAREAIQTPTNLPVHRAPRWAVPVALAATLVIAFAVVVNMGHMGHGVRLASSSNPAADAAAARLAETGESVESERSIRTGVSANQLRIQMDKRAQSPAAPPAVAFEAKPADAPVALDSQASNQPRNTVLAAASAPSRDGSAAAPEIAHSSDAALAKSRTAAPAVAMPHAVAKASGASEAPKSLVANNGPQRGGAYLEPTGAARSTYTPAPSERRAIVPAKSEMSTSTVVTDRAERESAARAGSLQASDSALIAQAAPAPPLASASPSSAIAGTTTDTAPLSAEAKRANPQAWLREIESLRAAGKTAEANRQLAEFRKAFPNEPTQLPVTRDSRPVQ